MEPKLKAIQSTEFWPQRRASFLAWTEANDSHAFPCQNHAMRFPTKHQKIRYTSKEEKEEDDGEKQEEEEKVAGGRQIQEGEYCWLDSNNKENMCIVDTYL